MTHGIVAWLRGPLTSLIVLGILCPSVTAHATSPSAPLLRIYDLTFVDANYGWISGSSCPAVTSSRFRCVPALRTTDDGGRSWRALSPPRALGHLRFATVRDGWTFGPFLFVTHDGGRTWRQDTRLRGVVALAAADGTVWAVTRRCFADTRCVLTLFTSIDRGRTWHRAAARPPLRNADAFVHPDARDAWLLQGTGDPHTGSDSLIVATHDGGHRWRQIANPCLPRYPYDYRLAALDAHHLWLLCGGEPGAGSQAKALYVSRDGGQRWSAESATCPPPTGATCGTFPGAGYVSDLAASTLRRQWIVLQRGTLYGTSNGGRTWRAAIPYVQANPGDIGIGPIVFADARHGWLAAFDRIFRTTDGGAHWHAVALR